MLSNLFQKCRLCTNFLVKNTVSGNALERITPVNYFHSGNVNFKTDDRRTMKGSLPKQDEGTEGERSMMIDSLIQSRSEMFPTERTPNMLFGGIPFSQIPICNVRASKNNTIFTISDAKTGEVHIIRSCGIEGFKNTRKGTNVAAQATAVTFGTNAVAKGFRTVRLRLKGLGPGRMSAIKGLQMGGLNIISVTDSTPVCWNPPRARKQRRL